MRKDGNEGDSSSAPEIIDPGASGEGKTARKWTHDELAVDLLSHLKAVGTMVWFDMQLGPAGSPRPDVYSISKSFTKPMPMAYEVKISRQDFLSDATSGKWMKYLKYASGVVFAVPAGLVSVKEIPVGCGVIYRHSNKWRLTRKPTLNQVVIPQSAMLKLLMDGIYREGIPGWADRAFDWKNNKRIKKAFGLEAAKWISDSASIKDRVKRAEIEAAERLERASQYVERERKRVLSDMPKMWMSMLEILGLPEDANEWAIRDGISELRKKKNDNDREVFVRLLDDIDRLVKRYRPAQEEGAHS